MNSEELAIIAALIRSQRVAALGTLRDDGPFVSMVAYAAEPDFGGFLLHLSRLAPHTRQLLAASTSVAADLRARRRPRRRADAGADHAGRRGHADRRRERRYAAARERYLARLPAAAPLFDFPDFTLFRFVPSEARYIGGFARAYTLTPEHLRQLRCSIT